jgi:hypothetical protein
MQLLQCSVITSDVRLGDFTIEAGIVMAKVSWIFYFDAGYRI